jgi:tRNA(Ile)-lysidine synthase
MIEQLTSILQQNDQLTPGLPILAGVSGGADSMCLLDALHRLGYPVLVAHFHHGLRPEADSDANFVKEQAELRGLSFIMGREDVASFAMTHSLSIEEAARELRYRYLFAQAGTHGTQAVAVAHNADDQVETVLMHLLRGAGLAGLKGMLPRTLPNPWSEEIPLVRPLLSFWRQDILDYVQVHNIPYVIDQSNFDANFYRNRLRLEVLPYLETVKPGARISLYRMADILAGDYQALMEAVDITWKECVVTINNSYVSFDRNLFLDQTVGMQRQLFRRGIAYLRPGLRDISSNSIEKGLSFYREPTRSRQIDLVAGLRAWIEGDQAWLAAWEADLPSVGWPQIQVDLLEGRTVSLSIPGVTQLNDEWFIEAEIQGNTKVSMQNAINNADPYQAWLDADQMGEQVVLRMRHPGDRFQPLGMVEKSVKLADFMVNVKLPQRARLRWPLVCAGDQVAWIPGYRIDERFRIHDYTQKCLYFRLSKLDAES